MHPVDLIKKFPGFAVVIMLAVFFAVFGWNGVIASICSIVCLSIIAWILTGDDDDWFDPRGPRAA